MSNWSLSPDELAFQVMPVFDLSRCPAKGVFFGGAICEGIFVDGFQVLRHLGGDFGFALRTERERREIFANELLPITHRPIPPCGIVTVIVHDPGLAVVAMLD